MKFVSLRMKLAHKQGKVDEPSRATHESFASPTVVASHPIHTYVELRQQIHDDLRIQHPEWVEPDGESPMPLDLLQERVEAWIKDQAAKKV